MATPRIQLNRQAVRALMRSPEMMRVLEAEARRKGPQHPDVKMESYTGRNRDRVTLRSQTMQGRDALKKAFGR